MRMETRHGICLALLCAALTIAGCHTIARHGAPSEPTLKGLPIRGTDTMRIHYLDVGSGMCHVIQCPGDAGTVIVDDCGSTNTTNALSKEDVREYIQGVIKGHPVKVVLTHKDADHVNWIPYVLDTLPSGTSLTQVWAAGNFNTYPGNVQTWINDANRVWKSNVRMDGFPGSDGFTEGWDNGLEPVDALSCGVAKSYVLTVNSDSGSNASSLVLRVAYGDKSAILPGDATGATQNRAMENAEGNSAMLVTDILEMSHHGAETSGSNSPEWAQATQPAYLLASAGASYGHPRCRSVENYLNASNQRLEPSAKHRVDCGAAAGDKYRDVNNAIYTTGSQGTLVADVKHTGASTTISLYCGRDGDPCP